MIGYQIKITRLAEFKKGMEKSPENLKRELDSAIKKSVLTIHRNASLYTPVRTGNLIKGYRTSFGFLSAILTNIVKYAIFVEFGTKYFEGRFYLLKGIEKSRPAVKIFFEKALENVKVEVTRE